MDVSIFDIERTLAKGPGDSKVVKETSKRKKGELEDGEVWRAKNVSIMFIGSAETETRRSMAYSGTKNPQLPNNGLSLRVPVNHLCLTVLPTPAGSNSTSIVTGTKSGHVRRYDTRQRKPVDGWKVAREGGIGAVQAGLNEQ